MTAAFFFSEAADGIAAAWQALCELHAQASSGEVLPQ